MVNTDWGMADEEEPVRVFVNPAELLANEPMPPREFLQHQEGYAAEAQADIMTEWIITWAEAMSRSVIAIWDGEDFVDSKLIQIFTEDIVHGPWFEALWDWSKVDFGQCRSTDFCWYQLVIDGDPIAVMHHRPSVS